MDLKRFKPTQQPIASRALLLLSIIFVVLVSLATMQTAVARSASESPPVAGNQRNVAAGSSPIIDLNGPAPNHNYAATFTENQGPRPIVSRTMTITDSDSTTLNSASIVLTNHPDGAFEHLEVDTTGTGISAKYDSASGKLLLKNSDTISNYEKALRTLTYNNLSESPSDIDRTITFQLYDGANSSNEAISTVLIEPVNDAPTLHNEYSFRLSDIEEDDTNQLGNRVAVLIDPAETGGEDRITDPDRDAVEGIAIIGADSSNGTWQFSIDAGTSWKSVGQPSNSAAVLLDPSARIRFLPFANYHGTTSLTIRAWDQTSGSSGELGKDTSENGGSSAFSKATALVTAEVLAINDPPIADLNGVVPGSDLLLYHLLGSGSASIAAPQATIEDVDNEEIVSLKVTLTSRPDGSDELLKTETTSSQILIGTYNPLTGDLLLEGTASLAEYNRVLRGIVYDNDAASPTLSDRVIEVRADDGLEEGPVSSTTIRLLVANNAPQITNNVPLKLSDVTEDNENPPGSTVAEILASAESDPIQDDEGSLRGFAIVGANQEGGQWQFSVDGGSSWHDMVNVSDTSAVLVNLEARLRFLPDKDAGGLTRQLTVRAWDQTSGANGSQKVDASINGGSTAFSTGTLMLTVDVIAVNDPPELSLSEGITAVFMEDNGPVNIVGPSLKIFDVDSETIVSATISISNHLSSEADVLIPPANGSGIASDYNFESGVLSLSGAASISAYQAALRSVAFDNLSHDPSTHDRIILFGVSDGFALSNFVSSTVKVESVNDRPSVDLNGEDSPGSNVSVEFAQSDWGKNPISIALDLELQDLDDNSLIAATVTLVDRPDGHAEFLTVNTDGTNISAAYEPSSGQLQLTGTASLLDYRNVLRTVTYTNTRERPLTVDRKVRFFVRDPEEASDNAISNIVVTPKLAMLPVIMHGSSPLPETDEPNNSCQEAFPIELDVIYEFQAEDENDWYSFSTTGVSDIVVRLSNYEPVDGQILVVKGQCDRLELVGHNGDFADEKIIRLDNLAAGNYLVWIITDNIRAAGEPFKYNLTIDRK